jgi:hypothetical protein
LGEFLETPFYPSIYFYGNNILKMYHVTDHVDETRRQEKIADVEAEINAQTLDFTIIRDVRVEGGGFDIENEIPKWNYKQIQRSKRKLNFRPFVLRDLGIPPPGISVRPDILYRVAMDLPVYSMPDSSGKIISTIKEEKEAIEVVQVGNEATIDGIKSNWVKVKVHDIEEHSLQLTGVVGWCFGGYLIE